MDNQEKCNTYRKLSADLKKAINSEFYLQAIFIEYAILEDRFSSVLRHAGVSTETKDGKEFSISKKISKIESCPELVDKFYRDRLNKSLLDNVRVWIGARNELIHHMAKIPYNNYCVRKVALDGLELVRIEKNKSSSVISHLDKKGKYYVRF